MTEEELLWHAAEKWSYREGIIYTIGYSPGADEKNPWWWRVMNANDRRWKFGRTTSEENAKRLAQEYAEKVR